MSIPRLLMLAGCVGLAFVAGGALFAARSPSAHSSAAATPQSVAKRLVGRWTGPKFGAEANRFRSDRWQLVFERSSGGALIGRKRHRVNGGWSAYERIDAVVDSAGRIWAVDEDGTINGALRASGTLELVYQEPGTTDEAAAVVRLRRSS